MSPALMVSPCRTSFLAICHWRKCCLSVGVVCTRSWISLKTPSRTSWDGEGGGGGPALLRKCAFMALWGRVVENVEPGAAAARDES